jgi:hypothetical protein
MPFGATAILLLLFYKDQSSFSLVSSGTKNSGV